MREEHPMQPELTGLPPGGPVPLPGPSAQVAEMSEVAAVQAQVLQLGLVREARPVFVYDSKLAKAKTANAERQARHREKQAALGLVPIKVPQSVAEMVKEHGGDWSKIADALGKVAQSGEAGPQGQGLGIEVDAARRTEIEAAGGLDAWVARQVDAALAARPPVEVVREVVKRVEVVKEVEKPVVKMTAEQKRLCLVGQRVDKLSGWRASVLRWLL